MTPKTEKPTTEFYIGSHLVTVDTEMIPILSKFTWSVSKGRNTYYVNTSAKLGGKRVGISMHRLVTGMVNAEIDHINGNGLDNRSENLRHATKKQNSYNRVNKNKYGFRGVFRPAWTDKFAYQIVKDRKQYYEYGFETPEQAARAYDKKSKELHGEFGIRNFKD